MQEDRINPDITDTSSFEDDILNDQDCLIKVIGVGGGGGNAVNYMYKQDIANVNFVICNTDKQHLANSDVPNKLLIGNNVTHGRGAGDKPDTGRQCAESSAEEIRKLFTDGTEMVFVTAGMGGGTGTGASPVVAKIAKEAGMLTIGIVTIPFLFEGEKKIRKAIKGAEELKKYVDALLIINNENLIDLYPDLDFFNAFSKADDTLANAARSISEIISEKCYINVDFEDVRTTLKNAGTAIISTAEGEGPNRVSDAINNALYSPLLKKENIKSAKRLLLKFAINRKGEKPLKTDEMKQITAFTQEMSANISVKWGIADDPTLGDKFKITVLASGFSVSLSSGESISGSARPEGEPGAIPFDPDDTASTDSEAVPSIEDLYGRDTVAKTRHDAAKHRYAVLTPSQLDDHEVIALVERTPTYRRPAGFNKNLAALGREGISPGAAMRDASPARPAFSDDNKITF